MIHCDIDRFETWRSVARDLLRDEVPPASICWRSVAGGGPFFGVAAADQRTSVVDFELSAAEPLFSQVAGGECLPGVLLERIEKAACHRDPARWELFYRLLWRLNHGESNLFKQRSDADVRRFTQLARHVTLAVRQMQGEVKFETGLPAAGDYALAWYQPRHAVLRRVAPQFVRDFELRKFGLLTPDESVEWDGRVLQFGPGVPLEVPPTRDELTGVWHNYHAHSFRPDRLTLHGIADVKLEMAARARRPEIVFVTAADQPVNESRCASQILAEALADVGIDLRRVKVLDVAGRPTDTAVGHRPTRRQLAERRTALAAEIEQFRPRMLVSLGAVAAQTLFGNEFRVSRQHGQVFESPWAPWTMATYHPAALVRVPDLTVRARMQEQFLYDLHRVAEALARPKPAVANAVSVA